MRARSCHSAPYAFNLYVASPPLWGSPHARFWVDIVAVAFFVAEWLAYGLTLEHSAYGRDSLSARVNRYREVWIRNMLDREARMVDMQIMASLQNGTAFFASTSLMAIGGGLALLRATSDALAVLRELPVDLTPSPRCGNSNASA